jgi:outer membrane protein, heavy metal efflux system
MKTKISAITYALLVAMGTLVAAQPDPAADDGPALTLGQALAAAEANSPTLRAAAAEVDEAHGRLVGARTYPHNPRVEVEGADRSGPGGSTTDRGVGLSQRIEIAGQRGERTAAARAGLAAAEAAHERRRREVRAAVERAFAESVGAAELHEIERVDLDLTQNLLEFEERRLEAGAGTAIEVNLARAAAGRALHGLQQATAAWREARARLAEAAGLDPASPPRAAGSLPAGAEPLPPLGELTARALDERRDLDALRAAGERAERRAELERSLALPDLELGAFAAREEGDDVVGLRAGIALPLFDRNQGGIAESRAAVDRAAAELAAAELRVRREVAGAYAHHQAAAEALAALRGLVVSTLGENLELLRRAADAGELSTTDVLLLRRELIDSRREHVEAAGELWRARTELELAVGSDLPPAVPGGPEEEP